VSDERERLRARMMAALDGEIDDAALEDLRRSVEADPELREEWERMNLVKQATARFTLRTPPEEFWDGYWESVYNRLERGLAWILVSVGAAVLLGWAAWHAVDALLRDESVPRFIKLAIFAVGLGGILLLGSVAREKWLAARRDPYRRVRR